jgi:ABC-type sugar transport system substrate-binding protein
MSTDPDAAAPGMNTRREQMRDEKITGPADDRGGSNDGRPGFGRRTFLARAGVAAGAAVGGGALLAACGSKGSINDQIGTSAAATTGSTTSKIAAKYKNKTIGMAFLTLADPNVQVISDSFEEAAERANLNWKFNKVDGQGTPDQAQKGLQSMVSKGVDLIYLEGIPPRLVGPQLAEAKSAGIPVIGGFTAAPLDPGIAFDYAALLDMDSVALSEFMLLDLNQVHEEKGTIKVAMVDSDLDVILGRSKILKALLELSVNSHIEVVGSQSIDLADPVGSSTKIASSFLTQFPDLDAFWTNYPNSCVAAATAVAQANKAEQVRVYGHIANTAAIEALRESGSAVEATSWIDLVYTSYATVGYALDLFSGAQVPRTVSYTNSVPVTVLSRETIAEQIPGEATTWVFGGASYRDEFISNWAQKFGA